MLVQDIQSYFQSYPTPTKVLDQDAKSPDSDIKRDPQMIRLTGMHPFNSEAPLSLLRDMGFVTPQSLFFVRNHGAVPKDLLDWKIFITGLVEHPIELTMADILALPQVTVPVTLVCAGNRRKEQNIVQKGNGFNWGSAGASNAFFTGPFMAQVLALANPLAKAKYVSMEGKDALPNGFYGTCVALTKVLDRSNKILLAHQMNGENLSPDHGQPLRALIPGCIGGRSVKWLTKLILTDKPSDNYYHIYDNRVLPTMVTPQMAKDNVNWWLDERYAIYDLNVQSIITKPAHDEILELSLSSKKQTVSGYAYNGGGRRIGRVEVSFDQGSTWYLTEINYPEDDFRQFNGHELFGGVLDIDEEKCFAWCFWTIEVEPGLLMNAKDIVVRAMDVGMNTQPRDMYWSVLSMVNNCWHRVAIHYENNSYRFEHPCQPALLPGGWMERVKKNGGNPIGANWGEDTITSTKMDLKPKISMVKEGVTKTYTMDQVAQHNTDGDAWFVVENQVYDGTAFLKEHPGGADSIILASGQDATEDFFAIHSENAVRMLKDYHIGSVDIPVSAATNHQTKEMKPTFLNSFTWQKARLIQKVSESHDVRIFRYQIEHPEQKLGLPIGQHIFVRAKDLENKFVLRAYTPISPPDVQGYFELLVKIYFPCPPRFPDGGKLSMLLENQVVGSDEIEVKGPLGSFSYLGDGYCTYKKKEYNITDFCMVAAGSGITPIYQVLHAILTNPLDKVNCHLFDANRSFEDILCLDQLLKWQKQEANRFQIAHFLNEKPKSDFICQVGFLNKDAMESFYPKPTSSMLLLVCGPPGLVKMVQASAMELGWDQDQIVAF